MTIFGLVARETPPEKRNPIKDSVRRVNAARELFEQNFDKEGKPTTKWGKELAKRYYVPDYGESYKVSLGLRWKVRMRIRALIRKIWRWIDPPVCHHCDEVIDGMVMGFSINYLSNTWYHYDCYKEVYNLPKK